LFAWCIKGLWSSANSRKQCLEIIKKADLAGVMASYRHPQLPSQGRRLWITKQAALARIISTTWPRCSTPRFLGPHREEQEILQLHRQVDHGDVGPEPAMLPVMFHIFGLSVIKFGLQPRGPRRARWIPPWQESGQPEFVEAFVASARWSSLGACTLFFGSGHLALQT
jgi:hypothetical protein